MNLQDCQLSRMLTNFGVIFWLWINPLMTIFFFDLEMIEYQPSNFFAFHGPHFVSGHAMHERPISSHIGHTKDQWVFNLYIEDRYVFIRR